jgi:LysM repeat protein
MISLKSLLTEGAALTDDFMQKVMQWENNKAYKPGGWTDKKQRWFPHKSPEGGLPTIAYGHKLTPRDVSSNRFKGGISDSDAKELLQNDLFAASLKAASLVPDYKKLPINVRQGLINAAYRGEIKSKHNTIKLMNAGKWSAAAKEYLNNDEYRNNPGVRNRMDWNQKQFLTMAKGKDTTKEKPETQSTKSTKTYTVKSGDSLSVIASKYKTTVDSLKRANNLKSDMIKPGQKLIIK